MAHINHPGTPAGPDEHSKQLPGGEVHGHGVRDQSVAVHHEVTDIPLAGVTRAATITVVFIGLVMLLMWGTWGFFLSQARQGDPGKPEMSADDYGKRLPPTPRLQSVPVTDLAAYRAEQAAKLNGLAWVDQSAGTVRVPINDAMRLIVTRADTFADQHAKTPADHSWAFPGAAMMDRVNDAAAPSLPEHSPSPVPAHGTAEKPQQGTTAPAEQDKPHAAAPPQHEPMRTAALTIAALLTSATLAAAQGSMRVDRSLPSNEAPEILKKVNIEGHMNAQVPVDLTFRDETGRTVKVRDLMHAGRPVILVPVYYECPMLCTQVLNSLFTALGVISLNPGKDFEVVVVSFDPKEPYGLARDKKAAYMAKYKRPGTEGGFHFLTGDQTSIGPLLDTVGYKYQYDPAIDQYAHPAMIAVLTPDGRIAKYFLGIDYSARDLRFAMIEASEGHVGSTFERKVITWCYDYDPTTGKYGLLTMRLVQAGGIATIVAMLAFWTVMWRRERATAAA